MERGENKREYIRLHRLSVVWSVALALLAVTLVLCVWLRGVQVADDGMAPTLRVGDVVFFDAWSKYVKTPVRGDIYAVRVEGGLALGRIVGVGGERVQIDNGNVYINGAYLNESAYVQYADVDMPEQTLAADEFLLLPDARPHMLLAPEKMIVKAADLVGRALVRTAPMERIGLF